MTNPDVPIPVSHYDTDDIPGADRHAAWSQRGWPSVASVFQSRPIGEFSTEADSVSFDTLVVQFATGTPRNFDRSVERVKADGIDVLGVGFQLDGVLSGTAAGRAFRAEAGTAVLLDTAQPSAVTLPSGRSIQLAIPRVVADENFGPVRRLHGVVVEAARAYMLLSHLLNLRVALPLLTEHQRPRLARSVLDLLAIALGREIQLEPAQPTAPHRPTIAAVRQEIESRLGLPTLTVPLLCQRLSMSRSTLYRMFEQDGGIEAYIRKRRLEQVRLALLDPNNNDRIGDLAYRWGFSDASHLSRQFREMFGSTPRAFRAAGGG